MGFSLFKFGDLLLHVRRGGLFVGETFGGLAGDLGRRSLLPRDLGLVGGEIGRALGGDLHFPFGVGPVCGPCPGDDEGKRNLPDARRQHVEHDASDAVEEEEDRH